MDKINIDDLYNNIYVNVDIIIPKDANALVDVESDSVDFVFSSHSLEHAPNPIDSLIDYYRVVKDGGIVYTVIPCKKNTYDRNRIDTPISKLVKKWEEHNYSYTLDEFKEMYKNTINHILYYNKSEEEIINEWHLNSGIHHIYVYSIHNTIELILKILELLPGAELTYFEADWDIHFAITKNRVPQFNKTKAEKSFLGNVHRLNIKNV